jgi:hypothetical protein
MKISGAISTLIKGNTEKRSLWKLGMKIKRGGYVWDVPLLKR